MNASKYIVKMSSIICYICILLSVLYSLIYNKDNWIWWEIIIIPTVWINSRQFISGKQGSHWSFAFSTICFTILAIAGAADIIGINSPKTYSIIMLMIVFLVVVSTIAQFRLQLKGFKKGFIT